MTTFSKLLSTSCLLAITLTSYAAPETDVVRQTVSAFMAKNNVPGVAVELYVDGKPQAYYFGYANREKKTPITKRTIFEVGSISKIMTSVLFAQEIDFAKMSLTDPVTKYLPELPAAFNNVTVQSLATHTSGLPFRVPSSLSPATLPEPSYAPNTQWVYSNMGIGMLGLAIEKATHRDLNQLYQKRIAAPLGMQAIGLTVPAKLKAYVAQGYDRAGNEVAASKPSVMPGAGDFKLSADDMQRFLKAAIGLPGTPERLFYPIKMTQAVYVKLPDKMQGLAWQVHSFSADDAASLLHENDNTMGPLRVEDVMKIGMYKGDALIDKSGATDGFRAYIAVLPDRKSGIVILANKYVADNQIVDLGREILFKATKLN